VYQNVVNAFCCEQQALQLFHLHLQTLHCLILSTPSASLDLEIG
jgi:hypothetical protein